jgi:hypothetical protein
MFRTTGINLHTSNKIYISRKVIIIHIDTGSSLSSEDDSIVVLCVDAVSLQVDTIDWEKYTVSMLTAEVYWRWRQRLSLRRFYLPRSSHGVKCHKKIIVLFIWIQHLHLNSTSVRSILITASCQSQGLVSGLSSSLRSKVLCALFVQRLRRQCHLELILLAWAV